MRLRKYKSIGNFILIAGMLLCCLYAFHDMQTAEGIGLYFSMKLGLEQRLPLDLLVDVLGIVALAMLAYLPCKFLGYKTTDSYVRFLIGYLAVVPSLSLAQVINLFRAEQRTFLFDRGFLVSWDGWQMIYSLLPFLQVWVPLFILLYAMVKVNLGFEFKKWHRTVLGIMAVLTFLLFLIPQAENLLLYVIGYLGLLLAFECWEALLAGVSWLKRWYLPLFVLLLLKGIYRIVVLMSQV